MACLTEEQLAALKEYVNATIEYTIETKLGCGASYVWPRQHAAENILDNLFLKECSDEDSR